MQSMRSRYSERRKKRRLRMLRLLLYMLVGLAVLGGGWYYVHQPGFSFGRIVITGTAQLTEEDIVIMAGGRLPVNLLTISAARVREALHNDVRFNYAETAYRLPAVLEVSVQERRPALYVANAYQSYVKLDHSGMVLDVTSAIPDADAPLLVGEHCGNVYIGDSISNENVLCLLRFLHNIGDQPLAQFSEIDVDEEKNLKIEMRAGYPMLLGNIGQVDDKAGIFLTVFNEIKDKHIKAKYIDLRFAKAYIRLMGENEAVQGNERNR